MWHVVWYMRFLGGPLKIGGPSLQPGQPSGKSGPGLHGRYKEYELAVNFFSFKFISQSVQKKFSRVQFTTRVQASCISITGRSSGV